MILKRFCEDFPLHGTYMIMWAKYSDFFTSSPLLVGSNIMSGIVGVNGNILTNPFYNKHFVEKTTLRSRF